ncbi:MAG TPA: NifU family protein [Fimbriimonadaceae bacterium]|nr:NifU family protein [Fimbriimonadaceae bacterium]
MSLLSRIFRRSVVLDPSEQGPLFAPVKDAMREVQAYARSHGGEIDLLGVNEEGDVRIRFRGTCVGCPMSAITLRLGIEERLKSLVPGVRKVVRASD